MTRKFWAFAALSSGFTMALGLDCIPNIANTSFGTIDGILSLFTGALG